MLPKDYPEEFFLDLAIGTSSFEDVCHTYGLDPEDVEGYEEDPDFRRRLLMAQRAAEDTGEALHARCRSLVTNRVGVVDQMTVDPEVPASVRLEAFKFLVKLGRLEPEKNETNAGQAGPQLVLNIISPDGSPSVTHQMSPQPQLQPPTTIEDADYEDVSIANPSEVRGFF